MSLIGYTKSDIVIFIVYMHYDIVRMGLVSQIKDSLLEGLKPFTTMLFRAGQCVFD